MKIEGSSVFHSWVAIPLLAVAATAQPRPFTDQYCVVCHNSKNPTAGVSLTGLKTATPEDPALLERVLRKVSTGEMPPAGMPRPAPAVLDPFTKSLVSVLDGAAAANPNPGRPAVHRLNRAEYSNAIRDMLALDIQPGPRPPRGRFRLRLRQHRRRALVLAGPARKATCRWRAASAAWPSAHDHIKPGVEDIPARRDGPGGGGRERNERVSDDLPFDSRGGFALRYYFPVDAEYVIRVQTRPGRRRSRPRRAWKFASRFPPGLRTIGVDVPAGIRETRNRACSAGAAVPRHRHAADPVPGGDRRPELDLRLDGVKLKRFEVPRAATIRRRSTGVTISGPYNITGPGDTPSRARIFVCRPATAEDEEPCARTILAGVGRRAFRRPLTDADLKPLLAFYRSGRAERDFDFGIEKALRACWFPPTSSSASSRIRRTRPPAPSTASAIWNWRRASPSSCGARVPDDQLLDLAEKRQAEGPRRSGPRRCAACWTIRAPIPWSPISPGSGSTFATSPSRSPTRTSSPSSTRACAQSFQHETELFFQNILREDRSVIELLDANYTFLNQRLAEHYGIPNIYGAAVPQGDADRSESRRPAGAGQHAHGDRPIPTGPRWCSAASGFWTTCSARRRRRRRRFPIS